MAWSLCECPVCAKGLCPGDLLASSVGDSVFVFIGWQLSPVFLTSFRAVVYDAVAGAPVSFGELWAFRRAECVCNDAHHGSGGSV